jgi:hypothetical protein
VCVPIFDPLTILSLRCEAFRLTLYLDCCEALRLTWETALVESNPGWAAGIGQHSKAKRLAWALKGAPLRKKDLRLNAMGAVAEARNLRNRVTELMNGAGQDPDDAMVLTVFAESDFSALVPELARLPVHETGSDYKLLEKHADKLPIGFLVFVMDRSDPALPIFGHARPLIVEDPRSIALNAEALKRYEWEIKTKYGLITDEN